MKLKSRLIEIASVGLIVAFASNVLAQGTPSSKESSPPSAGISGAAKGSAGSTAPSTGPWTADNVMAARPFGNINVSAAGTSTESVRTWVQGRTAAERAEISGRCNVIANAGNASRYPADAQQFCRTYMMVASASPAPGAAPSTKY